MAANRKKLLEDIRRLEDILDMLTKEAKESRVAITTVSI
jgi:hypothetical protein